MFDDVQSKPEEQPDDRYTTRETLSWCMRKAGVAMFDLDVAACEESHKADVFYTAESNGLQQDWFGRVWCNPPYSDLEPWVLKAWAEIERVDGPTLIAMLLPANRTEQPFWQKLIEHRRDNEHYTPSLTSYFIPGRVSFGFPGNPEALNVGSPQFTSVLLVWRKRRS